MGNQRITRLRTMPYEDYLQTPEWTQKREQTLERDAHRCRACNSDEKLEVHHRTYARRGDEDLNDLTTLCEKCHEHFHQRMRQSDIMARTYEAPYIAKKAPTWAEYLLGMLIRNPVLISHVCVLLSPDDFADEDARALYRSLNSTYQRSGHELVEDTLPAELVPVFTNCRDAVHDETLPDKETQVKNVMQCAVRLRQATLLAKNRKLNELIRVADESGKRSEIRPLQVQQLDVCQQLRTLNSAMHLHV